MKYNDGKQSNEKMLDAKKGKAGVKDVHKYPPKIGPIVKPNIIPVCVIPDTKPNFLS